MKIIAKIMKFIGVFLTFAGLAGMDSDLIVIPIAALITGMAIAYAGLTVEGSYECR